jgi:ribonuclease R
MRNAESPGAGHDDDAPPPSARPPKPGERVTGVFQAIRRGGGFVVPDAGDFGDVHVPAAGQGTALHGDHVQVEIQRATRAGQSLEGAVTRVLRHANERLVGRVSHQGRLSVVVPKNPKIDRLLEIHKRLDPVEVPDGAWVVAEVTRWSESPRQALQGRLAEVLGMDDDPGLPVLLLVRQAGVPDAFGAEAEREAEALAAAESGNSETATRNAENGNRKSGHGGDLKPDDAARRDFRAWRIVTIDPATAKDFDDAVGIVPPDAARHAPNDAARHASLEKGWRVGVHIADVAHYVRPGGALDAEAYARATSIYPVDRVIPMLPEPISNVLCSLRQGEDKRTMSALFDVSPEGEVENVELCNSCIRSSRRFAYGEVQALFDAADRAAGVEIEERKTTLPDPPADLAAWGVTPELRADLAALRLAARALAKARRERGALDLDLPEAAFEMDADGRPTALAWSERFEAHRLIEELMIAANEAVARELERQGYPALYRVHEEPKATRAQELTPALARVGIPMPPAGQLTRQQLQAVLDKARRHPAARVIQQWILRTLMRARYQPQNVGHFGLASDCYLHFTSPIRRYPDLVVHRIVKAMLAGAAPDSPEMAEAAAGMAEWGRHSSQREELAQHVEWDAQAVIALDYMRRNHLGDVFEAFVSGVNPMGFFVALADYPVEGLVRVASIENEWFDLDEEYHIWRSRTSGATIAMGDAVSVAIDRIDVLAGQIDLRLVRRKGASKQPGRGRNAGFPGSVMPKGKRGAGGRRRRSRE